MDQVLDGRCLLVTAQRRSEELADALRRRGAEVQVTPMLGTESVVDTDGLLARTRELIAAGADTVVVTTGIGFRGWCETAHDAGLLEQLVAVLGRARLVARGPKARGALQAHGLRADWVAASETAAEIIEHLEQVGVAGERVVVQHHAAGDSAMEQRIAAAGATVVPLQVYGWVDAPDGDAIAEAARGCAAGAFDGVLFTSAPAAVRWLAELAAQGATDDVRARVADGELLVAGVGPVTADPLVNAGFTVATPDRSRMGALAKLVIERLG